MRLLLIEDEEVLGRVTALALGKASFIVDWVKNGLDAVAAVQGHEYDAILLDLGLPDMSGEDFVKDLRSKRHATPVIVLTARGQVEDRVAVLDLGADDYLVKPFDMAELCARLRAVKRRTSSGVDYTDSQQIGPLEFFQASRTVRWKGSLVTLTSKEFDVLETLVMRRPRVVSRSQLENALYGWGDEVESNAIEVYIHFLRRKFSPGLVVTVRGKGYQLGSEESLGAEAARLNPPAS
ncbi:MAG: response regulator transcription factor [Burkholderiaceae bacterium]